MALRFWRQRKTVEETKDSPLRPCRIIRLPSGASMDIEFASRGYTWMFYYTLFRGEGLWSVGRLHSDKTRQYLPLSLGNSMGSQLEALQALQGWLEEEFGNVLDAEMGGAVLRSLMTWVEFYCADSPTPTVGSVVDWPEAEGLGVFGVGR